MSPRHSKISTVSILSENAMQVGRGVPFETQRAFRAAEIGLILGWDLMKIQGEDDREFEVWRLTRDLENFNKSPFSNTRTWEKLKNSMDWGMAILVPAGGDGSYPSSLLRDFSGNIIKEVVSLVTRENIMVRSKSAIHQRRNRQLRKLRIIGDEAAQGVARDISLTSEAEQRSSSKEREF